jgi:hypothetical protein
MRSTLLSVLAVAVCALTGCASGPTYKELSPRIPPVAEGSGRVFFYRKSSMIGAGLSPAIVVDGANVGNSKSGGFFFTDLPPGNHSVSCSTETTNTLTLTLAVADTRYVRTYPKMGLIVGHVQPELVGAEEAKGEIDDLSYTGAPERLLPAEVKP